MILRVGEWVLDVYIERTLEYYAEESAQRCDCAYCRNFSASVDAEYPQLRPFLAQFGIDIDTPDESMPYDQPGKMWYENIYSVCGQILEGDQTVQTIQGVDVELSAENTREIPSSAPSPCFYLNVGMIQLPWILDEPMDETISPANEPSFLKKMWEKLLFRGGNDRLKS